MPDAMRVLDTDVLVVGGGAGGLWAAYSAKRHAPQARVTLVDARFVGRTGHTAFSNAWMVAVLPEDDVDACARDIIAGNEWMVDQDLVREVLALSHVCIRELEGMGVVFPRENGQYRRRPTRGLEVTKVMHPEGGGLAMCGLFREGVLRDGVEIVDRVFVTDLLPTVDGRVGGALGFDGRTGEWYLLRAKATVIATNSVTFRSGFVRDITGTGTVLGYRVGARLTNAEFSYLRPGTPKFYFEGITFAIQDGARFVNAEDEPFMARYDPKWGDQADVQTIAAAFIAEQRAGRAPIYLDMTRVPDDRREFYFHSTVAWMDKFLAKLDRHARVDMFDKTPYYPLNQMTKLAIKTGADCRSNLPGLLAAGLAQSGVATGFAGFHIGMCNGNGWIAGRSAAADAATFDPPHLDDENVAARRAAIDALRAPDAAARSDDVLKDLQALMFRADVTVFKHEARLVAALEDLARIRAAAAELGAPDTHELLRLLETDAMLSAAEMIFEASRVRTETRLSHLREEYPGRDDASWVRWVIVQQVGGRLQLSTEPIPTPLLPVGQIPSTAAVRQASPEP
jgi:succinate dehydrogenase/fumarate reductase flavoprotein subunit